MSDLKIKGTRLFVLDTNVLMHDPNALFVFEEHDIFIPITVIEELDASKKGLSEVARNVRQTARFLDELMQGICEQDFPQGIPLNNCEGEKHNTKLTGRLYFQTTQLPVTLPSDLPSSKNDNAILNCAHTLQKIYPDTAITVVSKDINLRIKAAVLGIHSEDYMTDRVVDTSTIRYSGHLALPSNFWESHGKELESWQENGRTFYKITGPEIKTWHCNMCIHSTSTVQDSMEAIVRDIQDETAIIELTRDFYNPNHSVWGVTARNNEQNYALNVLMDENIDFVTLEGTAGSGKTLLALAAGLEQTLEQNLYREIIMTRVTVPIANDIGFLPGTEEEKMHPWMGAVMDNLEVLNENPDYDWDSSPSNELLRNKIKIRSINFMRGRTFSDRIIIIDEAQNLTAKQLKTLLTRGGNNTKIICLGDLRQIDTPYLNEYSSGLSYAIEKFKTWQHGAHVSLVQGERSRLAQFAAEVME